MSSPISLSAFLSMLFVLPPLDSSSPTGTWRLNRSPNKKKHQLKKNFPHLKEPQCPFWGEPKTQEAYQLYVVFQLACFSPSLSACSYHGSPEQPSKISLF